MAKAIKRKEAAVAIIENPNGIPGSYLLLKRYSYDRSFIGWCLPGGQLETEETPEQGVIREIKEETGYDVEIKKKLFVSKIHNSYNIHVFVVCIIGGTLCEFPTEEHEAMAVLTSHPDFQLLGKVANRAIQDYLNG